jgi:hypothetical protein
VQADESQNALAADMKASGRGAIVTHAIDLRKVASMKLIKKGRMLRQHLDTDVALGRAVQSTTDPDDRETAMAMHILVVADEVGADVRRLSAQTGYEVAEIRKFENNLREARLWIGELADSLEWLMEGDERQMMFVLYVHAQVARGLLRRRVEGNVAIYLDHAGRAKVRIPIPMESVLA